MEYNLNTLGQTPAVGRIFDQDQLIFLFFTCRKRIHVHHHDVIKYERVMGRLYICNKKLNVGADSHFGHDFSTDVPQELNTPHVKQQDASAVVRKFQKSLGFKSA